MMREYGWSWRDYLDAEPTLVNALYAAACEHAGLSPKMSYRDMFIGENLEAIMSGEIDI